MNVRYTSDQRLQQQPPPLHPSIPSNGQSGQPQVQPLTYGLPVGASAPKADRWTGLPFASATEDASRLMLSVSLPSCQSTASGRSALELVFHEQAGRRSACL